MSVNVNEYRELVREWLKNHAVDFSKAVTGDRSVYEDYALGKKWQRLKFENGFGAITFPKEFGGNDGHAVQKLIFDEEELKYDLPLYFNTSLGMPVPMIIRYASDSQKKILVRPALEGENLWCQLFSEPDAGSDLAGLKTKAKFKDGKWLISGQKLWTTWAQFSDYGLILARTDDSVPKHKGLTMFFLDMKSAGIDIRPVRPIFGSSSINEVFFDEVSVDDDQRLGGIGQGFKLAIETLMMERYTVNDVSGNGPGIDQFVDLALRKSISGRSAIENGQIRTVIADTLVSDSGLNQIHRNALDLISNGVDPGPEGSIRKLVVSSKRQKLACSAIDLLSADGLNISPQEKMNQSFQASWITSPAARIAGGTDEILKNTIAEKVLGLPQQFRPDKGIPFNEISAELQS